MVCEGANRRTFAREFNEFVSFFEWVPGKMHMSTQFAIASKPKTTKIAEARSKGWGGAVAPEKKNCGCPTFPCVTVLNVSLIRHNF